MDYQLTQTGAQVQEILNDAPITQQNLEAVEALIPEGAATGNKLVDYNQMNTLLQAKQDKLTEQTTGTKVGDLSVKYGVNIGYGVTVGSDNQTKVTITPGSITKGTGANIFDALATIETVIPSAASDQNKLTDKNYVDSAIATSSANFVGTFESLAELQAVQNPTNNDYGFVIETDAQGNEYYDRYKYNGSQWLFEYKVESTPFTADQWAAIQSGITSALVTKLNALPTAQQINTALAGKQDTIDDLATIRSGASAGATAVQPATMDTALAGKQDTITDLAAIRSGAAAGATAAANTGDKAYAPAQFSGLGRVNLPKNITTVGGTEKNVLTQAMVNTANTIYVIQYDYDLNGQTITLPAGCVLEFDGGSVKNGTITGNNTLIQGRTDLSGVTLSGGFANKSFNLYDAGCTPNDTSAASDNATRMLAFIRSLENIKLTLIVPDGNWYFDTPLVVSGDFSLLCNGKLIYKADANNIVNVALTIGSSVKTFTQKHVIRLSQSTSYQFPSTPPDNVGVKFVNADKCDISILESINFAYCVIFEGSNGKSCCYNNVTLGMLGYGNHYCAVKLQHVGSGWCNENLFMGGMLHVDSGSAYKANNVGIIIEGSEAHASNGNVFIKPSLEGSKVAIRFINAMYNVVEEIRDESVTTDFEATGLSKGNIVTTEQGGNVYNHIPVFNVEKADRANILRHVVYKGRTSYVTYISGSTTYASGVYLDIATYAGNTAGHDIPLYGNNVYAGKIVDTSNAKAFSVALAAKGRCVIKCFDENGTIITPSAKGDVIVNNNSVSIAADGKTILAQGDQSFFMFEFTDAVKSAFIGCQATTSEFIEVSAYTRNANSELGVAVGRGSFNDIVPSSQVHVKKGDAIMNSVGQIIYWNGEKWMNECGYTAARNRGTTAERPTNLSISEAGYSFFDTDLIKEIFLSKQNVEIAEIIAARNQGSNANPSNESHANPLPAGTYYFTYSITQSWGGKVAFRKTNSVEKTDNDEIVVFANFNTAPFVWITAPDPEEYPYIYTRNAWGSPEVIKVYEPQPYWIEQDGATAGVLRHGVTADRPASADIYVGFEFFDETLGKPIYWNGTAWADATGTAV